MHKILMLNVTPAFRVCIGSKLGSGGYLGWIQTGEGLYLVIFIQVKVFVCQNTNSFI